MLLIIATRYPLNFGSKTIDAVAGQIRLLQRTVLLVWHAVPHLTTAWMFLLVVQGMLPGGVVFFSKRTIDSFASIGDATQRSAAFEQAFLFLILTGVVLLLTEVLQYVTDWVRTAQAEYFADYIKQLIHAKSIAVDIEYYESPSYHDLLEQVRGEAQTKPLALLENLGSAVQSVITILTFATILLGYGWGITLLLFAGSLPGLYVAIRFDRIYHKWWKRAANIRRWLNYFDAMLTHPTAAPEIRLFNLGSYLQERYITLRGTLRSERLSHLRRQYASKAFANGLSLITMAAAIGWVAQRVFYNLATLGDIVVFYNVFSRGQGLMRSFFGGFGQTVNNSLYIESLFSFLDLQPKIQSPAKPEPFPTYIRDGIRFRDVSFRYPRESRTAIFNLDLFIPADKVVAIVGVNGAGKSTLIKLLCRFYDVENGAIEIDGMDIRSFDLRELRRNMSVLFQFPVQFHETAANSIALGDSGENQAMDDIKNAAIQAGAHAFICGLPEKYETLLGNWFVNGCELSGGEWQRVALAKAYFRKANILILDEPTSFMDPWSEADWFERFRGLAKGKTGIIITHRLTIARRADLICVIDDGHLLESGTHEELVSRKGSYARSWREQQNKGSQFDPTMDDHASKPQDTSESVTLTAQTV